MSFSGQRLADSSLCTYPGGRGNTLHGNEPSLLSGAPCMAQRKRGKAAADRPPGWHAAHTSSPWLLLVPTWTKPATPSRMSSLTSSCTSRGPGGGLGPQAHLLDRLWQQDHLRGHSRRQTPMYPQPQPQRTPGHCRRILCEGVSVPTSGTVLGTQSARVCHQSYLEGFRRPWATQT